MTAAQTMRTVADKAAARTFAALCAADTDAGLLVRLARADWLIEHADAETAAVFVGQRDVVVAELGRRGL